MIFSRFISVFCGRKIVFMHGCHNNIHETDTLLLSAPGGEGKLRVVGMVGSALGSIPTTGPAAVFNKYTLTP